MALPPEIARHIGRLVDLADNSRVWIVAAEVLSLAETDGSRRTVWYWAKYI